MAVDHLFRVLGRATKEEQQFLFDAFIGETEGYVDWLEARDDPRGEALRQELAWRAGPAQPRPAALSALIAEIDPEWWGLVMGIDRFNCAGQGKAKARVRFTYRCEKSWDSLEPIDEPGARGCTDCGHAVYWCPTIAEAEDHARQGHCIAVPAGLAQRGARAEAMLGRPDYPAMWAERLFKRRRK